MTGKLGALSRGMPSKPRLVNGGLGAVWEGWKDGSCAAERVGCSMDEFSAIIEGSNIGSGTFTICE